ncbi:unnamed protein product [Ixodes persulcatus]
MIAGLGPISIHHRKTKLSGTSFRPIQSSGPHQARAGHVNSPSVGRLRVSSVSKDKQFKIIPIY